MGKGLFVGGILVVQVLFAGLFLLNFPSSVTGFAPINWQVSELIELGAALGLLLGVALGIVVLRRTLTRNTPVEQKLRVASSAFMEVVEDRFVQWGLTPAKHHVTLFAIKGLSVSEIASLRGTSAGTIKAQTNAIYRKSDVSSRAQLLSLFIDDLITLPSEDKGQEKTQEALKSDAQMQA